MPPANPWNSQHDDICGVLFRTPLSQQWRLAHDRGLYLTINLQDMKHKETLRLKFADAALNCHSIACPVINQGIVSIMLEFHGFDLPELRAPRMNLGWPAWGPCDSLQSSRCSKNTLKVIFYAGNDQLQLSIQYGIYLVKPPTTWQHFSDVLTV
ncbi:uncharacterized protein BJ212DRAFT_1294197 [Suillus subaureus]|uniref:Uncharacterized protein n=1 Tax=Suillus subaureus TaxID=48587 RepID=A0A9P7JK14_9AGAM|nr:uncharacterized protein BJ212DRAFT_1294197 [Suillus subaureus]KAG1826739.1 hypothetical protein BJ212DRAFT_1294197 [Suillus subaureus]